jgi:PEGA domain
MRRNTVVALLTGVLLIVGGAFWPSPANAQGRRGRVIVSGGFIYSPFFYDPFWGPNPYYGYGYGGYPIGARASGDVRVLATPKQAEVYVDGFYAGVVDDFDGVLQRLHTTPGGHAITLHLEGYRTVTQNIYVTPDATFKLQLTMDKLGPGETSAPPLIPARPLAQWSGPLPALPMSSGT